MQRWLVALCAVAGFTAAVAGSAAEAAGRIDWRLENSFRLFKNPKHTELHKQIYEALSGFDQHTPVLAAERALEERFGGRGWANEVFNETCYNQDADRYTACEDYILPKSHRILASYRASQDFWDVFGGERSSSEGCSWRLDSSSGEALARKIAPCTAQVAFDIPYPGGARLSVSRGSAGADALVEIKVRDLLVLGMGDSFGAGEGNPDHPAEFSDSRSHDYGSLEIAETRQTVRLDGYPARVGNWSSLSSAGFNQERARWWDKECHRSLYSHQLRAALQLAIENPQRAVTFLSYSCAGAEILDGIFLRAQVRECTAGEPFSVPGQISSVALELCQSVTKNAPMPAAVIQRIPELRKLSEQNLRLNRCTTTTRNGVKVAALKRPIDLVFLSVGGNDVGFTQLVADSILSEASIYRRLGKTMNYVFGVETARSRLELLKKRLDGLKFALELFFDLGPDTKVIMTGYPNMGYDADGMSACTGTKGMEVFPPFRLDASKVGQAEAFTTQLNQSLARFAGRNWTYVDGFRDEFRSHGLCTIDSSDPAKSLAFPRLKDGAWTPYKPASYAPYASRQRWFRTPNDAFMTTHLHAQAVANFGSNCSSLFTGALRTLAQRHWSPFQLFIASTYGGAFHPTAEGQARIADEVVRAARAGLDASN
jgi:hypothetical protein